MKNLIKPASILLYLLTIIVFFTAGFLFAVLTGAAENQGLAGGAIVLFYGVISAFFAFIISLFIAYNAKHKTVTLLNKILGIICIAIACYSIYNHVTGDKKEETPIKEVKPLKPVAPAAILLNTMPNAGNEFPQQKTEILMGMGFFKPNFYEHPVLYFYGNPNFEKSVREHMPTDSVVFRRLEQGGFDISYAPPWLVPEHLKLDYDMLYFSVLSVGRDFIEVNVNRFDGRTAYVNISAGRLAYWPEFLLSVNSVEFISSKEQTIRYKPLDHAGEVTTDYTFMRPVRIKNNWMMVYLLDSNFKKVDKGWIKWRENEKLLITYSLLS